jgi:hypothetical protein
VVTKFDATGANVINSSISDNGSRIAAGEGIDFSSDFSFVGNAEPAKTGRVQMFDRANVGFVIRGLNILVETLQGNSFVPTEVMRWTQSGNVGIGTATPDPKYRLDVNGPFHVGIGNNSFRVEGPAVGATNPIVASFGGSGDFRVDGVNCVACRFIVKDSTGFVGIGTGNPTALLTVAPGGTTIADAWTTRSSRRWKSNIHPLAGALEKVQRLRGVSYNQISDGKHQIGVIAEEVGQVLPEIVTYEKNGVDAQGVDYARLTAVLIEATKEQQQEITALRARAQKQDRDVQGLKQRNAQLRQQLLAISAQVKQIRNQVEVASAKPKNGVKEPGSAVSAVITESSARKPQALP